MLASRSPQRRAILERLGVPFSVRPADVAELEHGDAPQVVRENARRKALAVRRERAHETLLGCDTLVSLRGAIYGKPADAEQARATLRALSGTTHEVHSGVAVALEHPAGERGLELREGHACTRVSFRELDDAMIGWYLARGEWRGRAGAYAIQGAGAALVRAIDGDYENVVGLPLATLLDVYPELLAA